MSAKHHAAWVRGEFRRLGDYKGAYKASSRWHVMYNRYITWCDLEHGRVQLRSWTAGPPDGLVCAVCVRYFEKNIGMTPSAVSTTVAREHPKV